MTIDHMLEVLNAYKRGEKIEYYNDRLSKWFVADDPFWSFSALNYRIVKSEPKKIYLSAWLDNDGELRQVRDPAAVPSGWIHIPELDKEITLP